MGTQTAAPATEKQISYLTSLAEDRDLNPSYVADIRRDIAAGISKREASAWIDFALKAPRKPRAAAPAFAPSIWDEVNAAMNEIDTSFYAIPRDFVAAQDIDLNGNTHLFVRVRNYGGKRYLSRVVGGQYDVRYIPVKRPQTLLALATIIKTDPAGFQQGWHKHSGNCGRCNSPLTDQKSVARGLGPECVKHA